MKQKKTVNNRDLLNQYQANCARIQEIADACETENRERTEQEDTEYRSLVRSNELIHMKLQAANMPYAATPANLTRQLRELVDAPAPSHGATIMLTRDTTTLMKTSDLADTGLIPVDEQEMLKPIRAGLIYDKVGLNIRTGLSGGKLRWPKHNKAVAHFAEEGERLTDSKVDFSAMTVSPVRLGIAIPVTREELESTEGVVENVIREEMPAAVVDLINDAMFNTTGKYTDDSGAEKDRKVYGPLVEAAKTPVEFTAEVPTRKELLKMKSKVTGAGLSKLLAPCWVMTEDMKAELEDVKVDSGSGRFLCENDMILGYPVFTTPAIGAGNIAFGDWSYQAAGFFGPISLLVDPYTLARKNADDFVLNAHFATATLRKEAFVLGRKKTSTSAGGGSGSQQGG